MDGNLSWLVGGRLGDRHVPGQCSCMRECASNTCKKALIKEQVRLLEHEVEEQRNDIRELKQKLEACTKKLDNMNGEMLIVWRETEKDK